MRRSVSTVVVTCALTLGTASTAFAQNNQLPNGRPFQQLQQSIAELEAASAAQIADLQAQLSELSGRVDAVEQHNAVQDQLIGALQAAASMLQQRMLAAEANIDDLQAWNANQDALLNQLNARVNQLQLLVNSHGGALQDLFNLHGAQQNHLNAIQNNLNFLNAQSSNLQAQINNLMSQNNQQSGQIAQLQQIASQTQGQINNLNGQFSLLSSQYQQTRNQLASGCPPSQSIRQVIPGGPVICEFDTGQQVQTLSVGANGSAGPFGSSSATAVCPPPPAPIPGQPPSAPFVATGGGHAFGAPGIEVTFSGPAGVGAWRVDVRNPNPFGVGFTAIAHCTRNAP